MDNSLLSELGKVINRIQSVIDNNLVYKEYIRNQKIVYQKYNNLKILLNSIE